LECLHFGLHPHPPPLPPQVGRSMPKAGRSSSTRLQRLRFEWSPTGVIDPAAGIYNFRPGPGLGPISEWRRSDDIHAGSVQQEWNHLHTILPSDVFNIVIEYSDTSYVQHRLTHCECQMCDPSLKMWSGILAAYKRRTRLNNRCHNARRPSLVNPVVRSLNNQNPWYAPRMLLPWYAPQPTPSTSVHIEDVDMSATETDSTESDSEY